MNELDRIRRLLRTDRPRQAHERARALIERRGGEWPEALLLCGEALFLDARYGALHQLLDSAREEFFAVADQTHHCRLLLLEGMLLRQDGAFLSARDRLRRAIALARRKATAKRCRPLVGRLYTALGAVLYEQKNPADYARSLGYLQTGMAINSSLPPTPENRRALAISHGELGRFFADTDNPHHSYTRAIAQFEADLAICSRIGDRVGMGIMRNQIAACYNGLDRPREALRVLHAVLRSPTASIKTLVYGHTEAAIAYHLLDQPSHTSHHAEAALQALGKARFKDDWLYSRIATVLGGLDRTTEALSFYRRALRVCERARCQVGEGEPHRRRIYKTVQSRYYEAMRDLFVKTDRYRDAAACHLMGAARSWDDLAGLDQHRIAPKVERLPSYHHYREQERQLLQGERHNKRSLLIALDTLYLDIESLLVRKRKPVKHTVHAYRKYFNVIHHALPHTALVVFFHDHRGHGAFVLRPGIEQVVRFAGADPAPLRGLSPRALERVGRRVMAPLLGAAGDAERLMLFADETWDRVYFHAASIDGRFCIQSRTITYHLSAFLAARHLQAPRPSGIGPALFLAQNEDPHTGFATEATTLATSLRGARAVVGEKMTRAAVRRALAETSIVHIAAHNKHHGSRRIASVLECGSGELVTPADILAGGPIAADLVVLNGCETNHTTVELPREPVGHVSALLSMGARSVLAAKGLLDGARSLEMMKAFYGAGAGGWADAYTRAARAMIDKGFSPRVWAKYFLYGR